jgi:hypothetical protein
MSSQTYIGPITNGIVDGLIDEFKKKKTKDKIIKNIIDPLLCDIAEKYYPHVITLMVILALMILLLISILIISLLPSKKKYIENSSLLESSNLILN